MTLYRGDTLTLHTATYRGRRSIAPIYKIQVRDFGAVASGGDSATDVTNSATSCDVANGENVYRGANPEAFMAMSQDVIHLRGTNSTCSS